jgi:hypothetical protein
MEQLKNKVCGADIHKKFLIATILSSVIWAGFEAYVRSGQRCIARLVPEIAHRHAAIEAPYSEAIPEQGLQPKQTISEELASQTTSVLMRWPNSAGGPGHKGLS